ncbi:APC family permease [Reyranella sp.]|uniref:APC family permease n=1 Tax=Reyranella sp. TaxID=1929291 RepID=UPI0025ED8628|nr:APC family permease [Reyranella sp.]
MSTDMPVGALRKDALGVPHIVFFVVAAAAPLTAVIGVTPAAFMLGNGPGVPLTFLLVGVLYLLFSAGFTAMSGFVGSCGGFYSYIVAGLGPTAGVAGAMIALATYSAIEIGLCGMFGFFLNDMVTSHGGPEIAWWLYPVGLLALVYACGRRSIEFSGTVLACCMIAEVTILLLLGVAILLMVTGGPAEPVVVAPFGTAALMPGLGMSLVFVVTAFVGFEATAIFGEEARDRGRTIPRATYIAVILIALFYAFTTWTVSLYYGPDRIADQAAQHTATLYFTPVKVLMGLTAGHVMEGLLVASLFACALSFHNTLNRYLFAAGREGLLWRGLGRTHPDHHSPLLAGAVQTAVMLVGIALFALAGADPYAVVFSWMGAFSSLGILILQLLVSLAVIAFFWRNSRGLSVWRRLVAPALSALGLAACFVMMAGNLELMSGSNSLIVRSFPGLLLAIGLVGAGLAVWVKARDPKVYAHLGRTFHQELG